MKNKLRKALAALAWISIAVAVTGTVLLLALTGGLP